MRHFNEDDLTLFESLIKQGEKILSRYQNEKEEDLVNSKEFNDEYDLWRACVFRLFTTHFDLKNDIVFHEIGMNSVLILKKRSPKYVEILLRALKACYSIPYSRISKKKEIVKTTSPMNPEGLQPISININNENTQSQNQSQDMNMLVDLLKNSLAPYQLNELKEIAKQDIPIPEKRSNLIEKIMSFGANVGASILANMLTNPGVIALL